jgi:hypothetical protein
MIQVKVRIPASLKASIEAHARRLGLATNNAAYVLLLRRGLGLPDIHTEGSSK